MFSFSELAIVLLGGVGGGIVGAIFSTLTKPFQPHGLLEDTVIRIDCQSMINSFSTKGKINNVRNSFFELSSIALTY